MLAWAATARRVAISVITVEEVLLGLAADMLIGATAAHHGLTLITRNVRGFDGCGVQVFDPFK